MHEPNPQYPPVASDGISQTERQHDVVALPSGSGGASPSPEPVERCPACNGRTSNPLWVVLPFSPYKRACRHPFHPPLTLTPAGEALAAVSSADAGEAVFAGVLAKTKICDEVSEPWPWGDLVKRVGQLQVSGEVEGEDLPPVDVPQIGAEFGEPWRLDLLLDPVISSCSGDPVVDSVYPPIGHDTQTRLMGRIVACVNYCRGMSTDDLELVTANREAAWRSSIAGRDQV